MYQIETQLTKTPYVNQVCIRLQSLNGEYSKFLVEAALIVLEAGLTPKNKILTRHLNNLMNSYDDDVLRDAYTIMRYTALLSEKVA